MGKVEATDADESRFNGNLNYFIMKGNEDGAFHIASTTGEIIIVKDLDRERHSEYNLEVGATDRGTPPLESTCNVVITLNDVNDNAPMFKHDIYETNVSELIEIGASVIQVTAIDRDVGDNARITYDITSGNEQEVFALDSETGIISLRESLDFDTVDGYRFIVRATDSNRQNPLSALTVVHIIVEDENDNAPAFPVNGYYEFISENAPIGSPVFSAHANDLDRGYYGKLNYTIHSTENTDKFGIDSETGVVSTKVVFDYEQRQGYYFTIKAEDAGGLSATVSVQVNVESQDEFAPAFSKPEYFFAIQPNSEAGTIIGRVSATDKDEGPDGRIFYSIGSPSKLFVINKTSGLISLKRKATVKAGIILEVEAKSDQAGSLKSIAIAKISIGGDNVTWTGVDLLGGENSESKSMASWAIALIVLLILIVVVFFGIIVFLFMRVHKPKKQTIGDHFDTSFDTIATAPADLSQYPPRYNEIRHYDHHHGHHHGNTTSEMSEQSQSTSSGRGSADDNDEVEDEEIRMINEGPISKEQNLRERHGVPSSGIHEDDNMSDVSVHNTQEYLARLGIDTTKSESAKGSQDIGHSMSRMQMFEDERVPEGEGVNISNLIYAKLNEVSGEEDSSTILEGSRGFGFGDESQPSMTGSLSSIVHSEEELQGSYNWDYLLDWGPQYQPMAHVFSEIARLKDDSAPNFGPQQSKKTLNPQVKSAPPPLLTSVAPRSIAPVALNTIRTSQITLPTLPRSPISHDASFTSPAMSPSFSPALSPLATRSPSISPLMTSGPSQVTSTPHHGRVLGQRGPAAIITGTSSGSEPELRI